MASEVTVSGCRAGEVFEDSASVALFAEYERECANPLLGSCAPQREMYEALEATGMAQCFAAYSEYDGMLSGFAFVLTSALPHYGKKFASVESLYVARAARGSALGRYLMDAVESYCREGGCAAILYSAPVNSRLARLLFLNSDRYANTNHVFCRSLV